MITNNDIKKLQTVFATKNELKKVAVRAGLKIEKLYKDKYNYYAIFKK